MIHKNLFFVFMKILNFFLNLDETIEKSKKPPAKKWKNFLFFVKFSMSNSIMEYINLLILILFQKYFYLK
jgi:hypothetical protein